MEGYLEKARIILGFGKKFNHTLAPARTAARLDQLIVNVFTSELVQIHGIP